MPKGDRQHCRSTDEARFYILAGLGATNHASVSLMAVSGQAREIGGETQFSTTGGAGVKLYPGKNVGLELGVRRTAAVAGDVRTSPADPPISAI
jgi:opacity protein-like surface antigen